MHRLGKEKLRGSDTDEWQLDCPECGDTGKFNLWFNVKKNKGTCYKCHYAFRPITLVQSLEDCSFQAAVKIVKELTSPSYFSVEGLKRRVREALDSAHEEVVQMEELPEMVLPEDFISAKSVINAQKWPPYLMQRIGSHSTVLRHGLGWCEDGYYKHRLIIPIRLDGRLVSFIARAMWKPCKHCKGDGCDVCNHTKYKAYLYPKGTKTGHLLFNYDAAKEYEHVVLVEGAFDAIRVGVRGMAVLGSNLSDTQLQLLLASRASEVTLIFDPDAAGARATESSLNKLRPFFRRLRVVKLPGGHDPDFFIREELWRIIRETPLEGTRNAFASRIKAVLDTR